VLINELKDTLNVINTNLTPLKDVEPLDKEQPKDLRQESYAEFGLVLTNIINPAFGYYFGKYGIRVAGMYLKKDRNELHINLGYKIKDNKSKQRSINILLSKVKGYDPGTDYDFTSLGVAYSWNTLFGIQGLFAELGLAKVLQDNLGNVKDEPFVPCGYIGYIYRFIPN
jgi:hypothetical protein